MDETKPAEITIYGAYWCPDCRGSKQFLGEHQIPYAWVDIEQDKAGERLVLEKNQGKRIIPTIVFADGSILVEPSNAQLAAKLGLKTIATRRYYDLIIVGGGPAGLTAALYAAREGIDTLVIERAIPGGQAAATERLDNVPGFAEGVEGAIFASQLRKQAERFGVEILQAQEAARLNSHDNYHCVETADGSEYTAQVLLLATGSRYKRLGVPGEEDFIGAGIHFCATCDGPFYRGRPVAVIGGGNSAAEESLFLAKYVEKVILLVRSAKLKASQVIQEKVLTHPQIELHFNTEVAGFRGSGGKLGEVEIRNNQTGAQEVIHPAGVFVFIGLTPNTAMLKATGIQRNSWGFIITGHDLSHSGERLPGFQRREPMFLETSVPGVLPQAMLGRKHKAGGLSSGRGSYRRTLIREYLKTV